MTTIPCLTLTQPWASLVCHGLKLVETRSWSTRYRGPLAIHAAKGFPAVARSIAMQPAMIEPLWEVGYRIVLHQGYSARGEWPLIHDLPLGAVIATCRLVNCVRTEEIVHQLSEQEHAIGDYSPGRWVWVLADVERLPAPIPAREALGLWEFQMPEEENTVATKGQPT